MPRVGFEPTITAFEGAKTVHTLDLAATVTGVIKYSDKQKKNTQNFLLEFFHTLN
jgi:hypothetical protein